MRRDGVLIMGGYAPNDIIIVSPWGGPDFAAGDAQFLDPDPARIVQLRPVLAAEQTPGRFFGPSDRMLVYRGRHAPELRGFVRLKPGCRENTPRNVRRGIAQVVKFNPDLGSAFERASRGRPPYPDDSGV